MEIIIYMKCILYIYMKIMEIINNFQFTTEIKKCYNTICKKLKVKIKKL